MKGEERRKQLLNILSYSNNPISGGTLSKELNVSRQIIVQDISLLRANGATIFSTNNLRQFVDAWVQVHLNRDADHTPRMHLYGGTLLSFHGGAVAVCILWWLGLGHWTILGALIPAALALLWQRRDVRIRQAMGEKLT